MKKLFLVIFLAAAGSADAAVPDAIEANFPLVRIEGPEFLLDLSYNKDDNFMKKPIYEKFGIGACYLHEDMAIRMESLAIILRRRGLKAILLDCFRPHEAQHYLWSHGPDPRYVANPNTVGSMHSRGIAIDIALADRDGNRLPLTIKDLTGAMPRFGMQGEHFNNTSWHTYKCPPEHQVLCDNRAVLKDIMAEIGLRHVRTEWWHYELPGRGKDPYYPLISICGKVGCEGD